MARHFLFATHVYIAQAELSISVTMVTMTYTQANFRLQQLSSDQREF